MSDGTPLVVFSAPDHEGPVFDRACPKCRRFLRFPKLMNWQVAFNDACTFPLIECSRCGPVEPMHVGWSGDYT